MENFVVDNMFIDGCLACPLIVAIDVGRYCLKVVAVSPGHLMKWLLLMVVIHINTDGENCH